MDDPPSPRIAVIGGGIAGLAAALRISHDAPAAELTILERSDRLGGKLQTVREDGFVVEAGPDSFLASKPRGRGLCQELGLDGELQTPDPTNRGASVSWGDRLHPLPEGLTGLIPTRLRPIARTSLLSPWGKARLAADLVLPARQDSADESLGAFIGRRLGRQAYERLVEPLMAGIYAGDGDQLSLAATFPQLREAERRHGGLIRGVLAARQGAPPPGASPFLTPRTGTATIIESLTARLREHGARIGLNTTVTGIERHGDAFTLTSDAQPPLIVDGLVIATPAPATAHLLRAICPAAVSPLQAIPHVSSAIVTLVFPATDLAAPLPGTGYLVPRAAQRDALAVTFSSSKWQHRAPEGQKLVRVFFGRAGREEIVRQSDDVLIEAATQELRRTLQPALRPTRAWVNRWPDGMPQYTLGHLDRLQTIDEAVSQISGLALAGNGYRGVGIPDCIASGERAAENILTSMPARAVVEIAGGTLNSAG